MTTELDSVKTQYITSSPKNIEDSKDKKISVKKVLTTTSILFLLLTTLYFGYLYYSQDQDIENTNCQNQDIENTNYIESKEEEVTCDFDEIIEKASEEANCRVHFAYEYILEPNPNPSSPYAACKETLKSKIKEILRKSKRFDSNSMEFLSAQIDNGYMAYLIDNDFIVYSITEIWKVNIIEQTIDLLWEAKNPAALGISHLYVITENNTSRMFFLTETSGLGGTSEDQEILDNILKDMCDSGDLGTWLYDSSNGKIEKLYEGEECL